MNRYTVTMRHKVCCNRIIGLFTRPLADQGRRSCFSLSTFERSEFLCVFYLLSI